MNRLFRLIRALGWSRTLIILMTYALIGWTLIEGIYAVITDPRGSISYWFKNLFVPTTIGWTVTWITRNSSWRQRFKDWLWGRNSD